MKFPNPLIRGTLIKRYKRFLTDVELENGEVVVAHCANSGSMLSVKDPGSEVWLSPATNPDRKLKYTWELIKIGDTFVGLNTGLPNKLVEAAIASGQIKELAGYDVIRREVKYGKNSRIDILLESEGRPKCYVEVKSVTMRRSDGPNAGKAEFPDAVTSRGAKHLVELADMVAEGHRSVMVYLVQREDCKSFTISDDIDPDYGKGYKAALSNGVEALCYTCKVTTEGIEVDSPLPIEY